MILLFLYGTYGTLGTGTHQAIFYWQLCDVDFELRGNTVILQTGYGPACLTIFDSTGDAKYECFKGNGEPKGWQSLYYGNRKPAPVLVCSEQVDLPARFITLFSLAGTIKDATSGVTKMVSWTHDVSGQKHIVALNSIDKSDKNTFIFAQHDTKKVFLLKLTDL